MAALKQHGFLIGPRLIHALHAQGAVHIDDIADIFCQLEGIVGMDLLTDRTQLAGILRNAGVRNTFTRCKHPTKPIFPDLGD